jgi:hypothetical protein
LAGALESDSAYHVTNHRGLMPLVARLARSTMRQR